MKQEIFFSTDIESDGPIPSDNSMLSFASVAFNPNGSKFEIIDSFGANLALLHGAKPAPETEAFWLKNYQAYLATRESIQDPEVAMVNYVQWVKNICDKHNGKPVFAAFPAGYDFLFMYWYMLKFAKESPFSFSAFDLKSYVSAYLKMPYRYATKRNMPKKWFTSKVAHSHVAMDDAIEQGELIYNVIQENLRQA